MTSATDDKAKRFRSQLPCRGTLHLTWVAQRMLGDAAQATRGMPRYYAGPTVAFQKPSIWTKGEGIGKCRDHVRADGLN